ncbi:M61 family metallopeptidase [Coralloluteibacterium stylophorae]|uniref:M61 family metallopeptidase n=1 Tax=Coralloluteibacterium stylophorae TaxID=1776034 RepID=A0A8J7VVC6_9GAMM|nr:M61 family metallopeptidase [Coralloluteibacterium stylophorae]MBS7457032.1 M61 family metallopeptidase [Coralloluteibacterium stylophorae]
MSKSPRTLAASVFLALSAPAVAQTPPPQDRPYPGTLAIEVDATDLDRRIFHVRQTIPVAPGPLTLLYPQWIPGNHSPTGPINKIAGLHVRADDRALAWSRDPADVYAFRVDVPEGVSELELEFDFLSPTARDQGRIVMTQEMLNLQWNTVAMYPAGYEADDIRIRASVAYPAQWTAATALEVASREGDTIHYAPVAFETLMDSPIYAGRHARVIDLDPDGASPVRLNVFADAPRYLEASDEQIARHRSLVEQADRLFGVRHFDHYDFLFSLSDRLSGNGLEHHRSSENGKQPGYFTDWDNLPARDLLAHEYVHSWNGKFLRPADQLVGNYNRPVQDSLLWVYEGQTQYWGYVLTARAGLWSRQQALDTFARVAATYSMDRPGFSWRSIQDTTNDPIIAQRRPQPYRSQQLSEDYYVAGALTWLAVDAKLRELSGGRRSLDDFAARFFGGDDGTWMPPRGYRFEDVVAALEAVAPHDWTTFLRSRLDANAPPLDGLAAAGWRLVFTDTPGDMDKALAAAYKVADFTYSLGLTVSAESSEVGAVRWDGPAFQAGLVPGSTLVAVDGEAYTAERLETAVRAAAADRQRTIDLLIKDGELYRTVRIDYHEGLKYPHLERIPGAPDRLSKILAAKG